MLLFCLPFCCCLVFFIHCPRSLSSFTIVIVHNHPLYFTFTLIIDNHHSRSHSQPSFTSTSSSTFTFTGPSTTAARSTVFNVGAGDGGCRKPRARPVLRIVVGVLRPEKQTEKRGRGGIERAQCIDAEHVTLVEGRKIMSCLKNRENRIQ